MRKKGNFPKIIFIILAIAFFLFIIIVGSLSSSNNSNNSKKTESSSVQSTANSTHSISQSKDNKENKKEHKKDKKTTYKYLAKLNFHSGSSAYKIIDNDDAKIKPKKFKTSHIKYSNLDGENRSHTATAYLTKANLGSDAGGRASQSFEPTGWHNQPKYVNGKRIYPENRGHIIAYTISFGINNNGSFNPSVGGSFNNPLNLFTQTAFSNQQTMQITEGMVRDALAKNKHVIYKVTPVYRKNNLMANGVWVRARTTDNSMHFNRYLYNVQPGLKFDYKSGNSTADPDMTVQGITISRPTHSVQYTKPAIRPTSPSTNHTGEYYVKPSVRHYKNGKTIHVRGYWRHY